MKAHWRSVRWQWRGCLPKIRMPALPTQRCWPNPGPTLNCYDSTEPSAESLIEAATAAEAAALSVPGVSSSVGAGAGTGLFGMVLATSHGFSGTYERSGFSRSVSVIAGEGVKMERDYDFDSRVFFADLDEAEAIGRRAGERAAAR
jgi:PmbA protein